MFKEELFVVVAMRYLREAKQKLLLHQAVGGQASVSANAKE